MPCILLDFPCVSQILTRSHYGSILQVDFSTRLDVAPKRRHATHYTLYSIAPCILIDFPTRQSVEFENKLT